MSTSYIFYTNDEICQMRDEVCILEKILLKADSYDDLKNRNHMLTILFHHFISKFNTFQKTFQFNQNFRNTLSSKMVQLQNEYLLFQELHTNMISVDFPFTPFQDDTSYYNEIISSFEILQKCMCSLKELFP